MPSRGLVTVAGHSAGHPFVATLQSDGQGNHWLKVEPGLREAAGIAVGDLVELACTPVREEPGRTCQTTCTRPWPPIPRRWRSGAR